MTTAFVPKLCRNFTVLSSLASFPTFCSKNKKRKEKKVRGEEGFFGTRNELIANCFLTLNYQEISGT